MRGRKTRGKSKSAPPSAEQAVGKRAQVPSPASGYASVLHQDLRHYPQAPLRWAGDESWMTKSQVLLCHQSPPSDAILFVHGWGGAAGGTWEAFPQAVGIMPEASRADVFFLDYPSVKSQVPFCAAQLRRFLVDLVRDPIGRMIDRSLPAIAPKRAQN